MQTLQKKTITNKMLIPCEIPILPNGLFKGGKVRAVRCNSKVYGFILSELYNKHYLYPFGSQFLNKASERLSYLLQFLIQF